MSGGRFPRNATHVHGRDVRLERGGVHRDQHQAQPHQVRGLLDGGVRGYAGDDLGVGHALGGTVVVAVGLGGEDDGLGAWWGVGWWWWYGTVWAWVVSESNRRCPPNQMMPHAP